MTCVVCTATKNENGISLKQSEIPTQNLAPEVGDQQNCRRPLGLLPLFIIHPQSLNQIMRFYKNEELLSALNSGERKSQANERMMQQPETEETELLSVTLPPENPPLSLDQLKRASDQHGSLKTDDKVNVEKRYTNSAISSERRPREAESERRVEFISPYANVDSLIRLRPPENPTDFKQQPHSSKRSKPSPDAKKREKRSPQFYYPYYTRHYPYHGGYRGYFPHFDYYDHHHHHHHHY